MNHTFITLESSERLAGELVVSWTDIRRMYTEPDLGHTALILRGEKGMEMELKVMQTPQTILKLIEDSIKLEGN